MRPRMLALYTLLMAVAASVPRPLAAQDSSFLKDLPYLGGERQLVRITPDVFNLSGFVLGGRIFTFGRCGDYFRTADTPRGVHLVQIFRATAGDPPGAGYAGIFNPRHYRIVFDDRQTVPTEEVVDLGGGQVRIDLRMSHDEYARCPCLHQLRR